jgi:hypothetical protein
MFVMETPARYVSDFERFVNGILARSLEKSLLDGEVKVTHILDFTENDCVCYIVTIFLKNSKALSYEDLFQTDEEDHDKRRVHLLWQIYPKQQGLAW